MVRRLSILLVLLFGAFYCYAQLSQNSIEEFNILFKAGYYKDAVDVGHSIEEDISEKNNLEYAIFLDQLAKCEYELEDYSLAQKHLNTALKIKRACCGKKSVEYARTLHFMAECHGYMGSPKAFSFEKKAFRIVKKKERETSPIYIEFLMYYSNYLDADEQLVTVERYLPLIDTTTLLYAQATNALADCYYNKEQFEHAIKYYLETIQVRKQTEGDRHPDVAGNYYDLVGCYTSLRVPSKVFEYSEMAEKIYHDSHGVLSDYYLCALIAMADAQAQMGSFGYAKKMSQKALSLSEKRYGQKSLHYASALASLSLIEQLSRNFDNAILHAEEAIMIIKNETGEEDEWYLNRLLSLSELYLGINDSIAKSLAKEYVAITQNAYGDNSAQYAYGLVYYAHILNECDETELQLIALKEAYDIYQQIDEEYSAIDMAEYWDVLSDYYWFIDKKYDSALLAKQQASDLYYSQNGANNDSYIRTLGELGEMLCNLGMYDDGYIVYENYLQLKKEYMFRGFVGLNESERFLFWTYFSTNKRVLDACGLSPKTSKFTELAYNMALFNKGLLLNTELCFRKLSEGGGLYVENNYEMVINQESNTIESLRNSLSQSWQDIQKALQKTQMAIEFVSVSVSDSLYYYALVLKPKYEHPKMIKLFETNDLDKIDFYSLYNSSALYDLVWEPLENEFEGVETICFSPEGELNNLAIESALTPSGQRISDCFNMRRLSSTREIATLNDYSSQESIVLYGGLDYFANSNEIEAANKINNLPNKSLYFYAERSVIDDDRGGVGNLVGSKREVNTITHILPSYYSFTLFTDQMGTEESFKALSGNNYRIIHVSTHGYYWSESMSNRKNLDYKKNTNYDLMTEEDKALTRSGLYFAGVNATLSGEEMPDYLDDGILTAQEISELDLRGTDLVVLSACQTGLGDLKGDGVFGLQRGFKKAGVRSILMSLWKVDDNATELLMVEFYRNYFSGVSKTQSLKNAQQYVRDYSDAEGNKLYENPYYWAGFVMLD